MVEAKIGKIGCVVCVLVATLAAQAEDPRPRAQQLEYDPSSAQFVDSPPPIPGTPLGDLRIGRQYLGQGDYGKAKRQVKQWLKDYGPDDPLTAEAYLLRAEVGVARRDYYKAYEQLKEFVAEFAGGALVSRALELEFTIAEVFLSGTKRKILGMRLLKAQDKGIEILDEISSQYPESRMAELAIKTKADYYFDHGEYGLAELEYSRLPQEFPRSRYVPLAMLRSAQAALASFAGIEFDDAPLIEAQERFRIFSAQYPVQAEQEGVGQILRQIDAQRAAKEFSVGQYYERTKHASAATFYYRTTCDNWPDTVAASQARERLADMGELTDFVPGEQEAPKAEAAS